MIVGAELPDDNPKLWQAMACQRAPAKPPYPSNMLVTPLSTFQADEWAYPMSWASLNNRKRLIRHHLAAVRFADGTIDSLLNGQNPVLIRQLKEACWAFTYRNDLTTGFGTPSLPKPLSEHGTHQRLRRLLIAFKRQGCATLSDVGQEEFDEAIQILRPSPDESVRLASDFHGLIVFSKHGLISDGIRKPRFEITSSSKITDHSGPRGFQPLTDDESSSLIRTSLAYIDQADEIISKIELLRARSNAGPEVARWARRALPCGPLLSQQGLLQSLTMLIQIPAANMIMFHVGLRVSELLSIRKGFASKTKGETEIDIKKLTIEFIRYKTIRSYMGKTTKLGVHSFIFRVGECLEYLRNALGNTSEHLFAPPDSNLPYVTNSYNYYLQRFCDVNSLDIRITSHRWRETVAATAVRVLTGSALYVKEIFGHSGFAMPERYMFSSPFIRGEVQDLLLDEYRKRGRSLLDSLTAFGGSGLGGIQGKEWEAQFTRLSLDRDVTETDLRQTQDEFLEEMLRQGILPRPVIPGVFCLARPTDRGECSRSSKDRLPDTARCSAQCTLQVQEAYRKETIVSNARRLQGARLSQPQLVQHYWAKQIADQLQAWPELEAELRDVIDDWPALREAVNV